jgi:hypothetical protein
MLNIMGELQFNLKKLWPGSSSSVPALQAQGLNSNSSTDKRKKKSLANGIYEYHPMEII